MELREGRGGAKGRKGWIEKKIQGCHGIVLVCYYIIVHV